MNKIILKNTNNSFTNYLINNYIKNITKSSLYNLDNKKYYDKYLIKTYNISLNDLITSFYNNIKVIKDHENYILFLDSNVHIKSVKLITLVDLLNYGNQDIKGLNFFNNIFSFIQKNIDSLILLYDLKEGNR